MSRVLPKLTDVKDWRGRYVLLRASLNVPLQDGEVRNQFRIARALPTINFLRRQGARLIIIAHIGREPEETLTPVYEALREHIPLNFFKFRQGELLQQTRAAMQDGDVLLLENIRQDERETKNDPSLALELANLCDIFVIDAFAAAHRAHTSVVGVAAHRPTYFGMNFVHEYEELSKATSPQSPSLFILGGAKFETKMPLVEKFIDKYEHVFIGGALANDIFKARGYNIGQSLVSEISLVGNPLLNNPKLLVPIDVTVDGPMGVRTCAPNEVADDESIFDAGPKTIAELAPYIAGAKTILWNGPLGNYEAGFEQSTLELGRLIAAAPGYAILGGGDTIAAIETLDLQEKFGFLSTAGGAMLTFMETGTLPALDAVVGAERQLV